ncbi:hypothetical protein BD626DRAFT_471810 [Schizophyllum amplum]|uniref:Uncharacterized protein n=1 Tax=Schizophyllum amplum TaxID=97359 RepID=A0A550CVF6_9AGAR|nr:hypothetical protein BD626DRAFT_471810 [Auriculariopsis ampla]
MSPRVPFPALACLLDLGLSRRPYNAFPALGNPPMPWDGHIELASRPAVNLLPSDASGACQGGIYTGQAAGVVSLIY